MQILMRRASLLLFFFTSITFAQFEDINDIAEDLVYLSAQYVNPAAEAAVFQFSGGWYTSAKKKELWGLEISLQGNILFIPNKSKDFLIRESALRNLSIQGATASANTPTALGEDNYVVIEGHIGEDTFEFDSPEGINESYVRHAQIQASLGLWKGTTLIGRYSPQIKINKTSYQIFGFGLQHNISQWMPSFKESTFDIAGIIAYSDYSVSDTFSDVDILTETLNSVIIDGQSFMFSILVSKALNNFNFSTAIGVTSSRFRYEVGGNGDLLLPVLNQVLNTLNESQSDFKADLGVDYEIKKFSINTMLTFGNYTNLIFGVNYNL